MRRRLAGRIVVPLAAAETFRLFTPRGEQEWVHGWDPWFPASQRDDSEPGTVFVTDSHGQCTTWVVTDRRPPIRIGYARVSAERAGTVTITVTECGEHSEVQVVYDMTSLSAAADVQLERFADEYVGHLQSWEHHILAALTRRGPEAGTSLSLT